MIFKIGKSELISAFDKHHALTKYKSIEPPIRQYVEYEGKLIQNISLNFSIIDAIKLLFLRKLVISIETQTDEIIMNSKILSVKVNNKDIKHKVNG